MKSIYIIILSVISLGNVAQQYEPMLAESNEWHLTTCYNGCITDVYLSHDDTIVDGLSYKILNGYHYISRTFLLREDIGQKQVFLMKVSPTKNDEYLLYDFSLLVGDSIEMQNPISPFPSNGGWFLLDSIKQKVIADGNSYRHFYLSPTASNTISTEPAIWIESIGSLSLINAPGGDPDINGAGHLSCLFKNGEIHYRQLDSISDCAQLYSLGVEKFDESFCSIKSNLIGKSIDISLELPSAVLKVYNIKGELVNRVKIYKGTSTILIDEPSGMYIAIIETGKGLRKSEKIVIQ